jgi:hypothetical protein
MLKDVYGWRFDALSFSRLMSYGFKRCSLFLNMEQYELLGRVKGWVMNR